MVVILGQVRRQPLGLSYHVFQAVIKAGDFLLFFPGKGSASKRTSTATPSGSIAEWSKRIRLFSTWPR